MKSAIKKKKVRMRLYQDSSCGIKIGWLAIYVSEGLRPDRGLYTYILGLSTITVVLEKHTRLYLKKHIELPLESPWLLLGTLPSDVEQQARIIIENPSNS